MENDQNGTIRQLEEKILQTEKEVLREERQIVRFLERGRIIRIGIAVVLIAIIAGFAYYWFVLSVQIFTDKAVISAPLIEIGPQKPEILKQVMVQVGSYVAANTPVARLDDDYLTTNIAGTVVDVNNTVGKLFEPGTPVVTMIDPKALRVVASVDETNGFADIRVGQKVNFTVDAFGSRQFEGMVDEIGNSADQTSVVFNISDKRATKQFDVKIKYDVSAYPELLNGMSAKVWIHK